MRTLLLSAGLCLACYAHAEDAVAPSPVSGEDYGLAITYGLVKKGEPTLSKACMDLPEVKASVHQLLEDDLALYARGAKNGSWMGENPIFTAQDRADALQLQGFVREADEAELKQSNPLIPQAMGRLKALDERVDGLKGSDGGKTFLEQQAALYEEIKAGRAAVPATVKAEGCLLSAFLTAKAPTGLFISTYKPYLAAKLAEYRSYRSQEGYQAARWGMTPAEVRNAEALPSGDGKTVKIDGQPARVSYLYTDGRLSSVRVKFLAPCLPAVCYERYLKVSEILQSKYGDYADNSQTDEDTLQRTSSSLYQSMNRDSGLVADGYRREIHTWTQADSRIDHTLSSTRKPLDKTKGTVIEEIVYTSIRFAPRARSLERAKAAEAAKARQQNI